jgi:hypothetical protein
LNSKNALIKKCSKIKMFKFKNYSNSKSSNYKIHIKPTDKTKTGEETNRTPAPAARSEETSEK